MGTSVSKNCCYASGRDSPTEGLNRSAMEATATKTQGTKVERYVVRYGLGLPVTATEDPQSAELAQLAVDTHVEVLGESIRNVGGKLRARIANADGWITIKTAKKSESDRSYEFASVVKAENGTGERKSSSTGATEKIPVFKLNQAVEVYCGSRKQWLTSVVVELLPHGSVHVDCGSFRKMIPPLQCTSGTIRKASLTLSSASAESCDKQKHETRQGVAWNLQPSVGTWLAPPSPLSAAKAGGMSVAWNLQPSVGTWLAPAPVLSAVVEKPEALSTLRTVTSEKARLGLGVGGLMVHANANNAVHDTVVSQPKGTQKAGSYTIGECVEVRDFDTVDWKKRTITCINPLKANGMSFKYVRKIEKEGTVEHDAAWGA